MVSYLSLPLISHIINKLGSNKNCRRIIIIIDYKEDVFRSYLPYLKKFHQDIDIELISSRPYKGTASGIRKAIDKYNIKNNILFSWCDLIPIGLSEYYYDLINKIASNFNKITIFYSQGVKCRWSINTNSNEVLQEKENTDKGVLGLFYIPHIDLLDFIDFSGESKRFEPSIYDLKIAPSSFILIRVFLTFEFFFLPFISSATEP